MDPTDSNLNPARQDGPEDDTPGDSFIHERFERMAERNGDNAALVFHGREMSYRELNERSSHLAQILVDAGVSPDSLVGVLLPKSMDVPVALLAILKAGGAYVPIDPAYPENRVAFMLEDSRVPVLLTDRRSIRGRSPLPGCRHILVDELPPIGEAGMESCPRATLKPSNLAYMIYTSGSTGQPKGVLIEHRGLANVIGFGVQKFALCPSDRVLHFVSFSFDAATSHLFMALCSGATSVLTTRDEFGRDAAAFLRQQRITHAPMPASVLETIPDADIPSLKTVTVGAEACSPELAARWGRRCAFHNMYGPTECTIFVTTWDYQPGFPKPPIGYPVPNTEIQILDEALDPVPAGEIGELHIGGIQLARGYLNQPELTARKFIDNPFGEGRLYKSGDLGRILPDGAIEYCGRIDEQVKVHGYRIEPGEIEEVLRRSPSVRQAVVLVAENQLFGFVVPCMEEESLGDALKAFLSQILPEFMIPSRVIPVAAIPLTPEGKTDRAALLSAVDIGLSRGNRVQPTSPLEQVLVRIWQDVLPVDQVGLLDNFFEIGGDSISAMKIVSQARAVLKIDFPMSLLFDSLTIHAIVEALEDYASVEALEKQARVYLQQDRISQG